MSYFDKKKILSVILVHSFNYQLICWYLRKCLWKLIRCIKFFQNKRKEIIVHMQHKHILLDTGFCNMLSYLCKKNCIEILHYFDGLSYYCGIHNLTINNWFIYECYWNNKVCISMLFCELFYRSPVYFRKIKIFVSYVVFIIFNPVPNFRE